MQIEIVAAEPSWARSQVQTAMKRLGANAAGSPDESWTEWSRTLRYLNTRESALAMIDRMGRDERPRSAPVESADYVLGLVGFADRAWLVPAMQHAAQRADYAVTQPFVETLMLLQNPQRSIEAAHDILTSTDQPERATSGITAIGIGERNRANAARTQAAARLWQSIADAVDKKAVKARAMTLHTLLELAWLNPNFARDAGVRARVPKLVAQLALVLDTLPERPLSYVLGDEWQRVSAPAMLPALRRLWARAKPLKEYERSDVNDLILRRLHDLAPAEGRELILEEIASPHPRTGIDGLESLPDKTLPQLDKTLLSLLENENADACLRLALIERYATRAILPSLKTHYDVTRSEWDFDCLTALLAYYLRVDPAYGAAAIKRALAARKNGFSDLLSYVAELEMNPALEQVLIDCLEHGTASVQLDAAKVLGRRGTPRAESALLARLRRPSGIKSKELRGRLEAQVVEALAEGNGWLTNRTKIAAIRALCTTDDGRRKADEYKIYFNEPKVHVDYQVGVEGYWSVGHYHGEGLAGLKAKMAQYPRGTVFSWQQTQFGRDAAAAFSQLQRFAGARGMKLELWKMLRWN
jgi:hypothetical protein